MGAVLRHLPVAVRLLRLETAVRDLHNAVVQKAPAGAWVDGCAGAGGWLVAATAAC
jgi:hypothetical protein